MAHRTGGKYVICWQKKPIFEKDHVGTLCDYVKSHVPKELEYHGQETMFFLFYLIAGDDVY